MAKRLLSKEIISTIALDLDYDAYDRKVLNTYMLPDGKIKQIPTQEKKREVILRYLASKFDLGIRYSEKQVNEIISHFHEDTATLRRLLVGYHFLAREGGGGDYWRVGGEEG